jgi:hypothetical protein
MRIIQFRTILAIVAIVVVCGTGRVPAQAHGPNIQVEGDHFLVDGSAKFLIFVSYFDALRASPSVWASDLDWLSSKGIDGVRIFPNWWPNCNGGTPNGDALIDENGNVRGDTLTALQNFLAAAAQRQMLVDVTFTRDTVSDQMTVAQYKNAVAFVVGSINTYRNAVVDVQNEWDLHGFQQNDITSIVQALKIDDPSRLATASTGSTNSGAIAVAQGLDFVAHHDDRNGSWYTDATIASVLNMVRQSLGTADKPIDLQEPMPFDYGCAPGQGSVDLDTTHAAIAVSAAKARGASVWTLHTRFGFDLTQMSLQASLTAAGEVSAVENLRGAADAQPSWGVAAFVVSPSSVDLGASAGSKTLSLARATGSGSTAPWHASSNVSWIHLDATQGSGLSVTFRYDANLSGASRSGAVTIAGRSVTVTQSKAAYRVGDYDGDGHADLGVWHPSSSTWNILLSGLNFDGAAPYSFAFGSSGDVPLSADMDADGKSDLVVFRPSTGMWYWTLAATGYDRNHYTSTSSPFGGATDIPLVGDVDGDGMSDLVVWRPSTGQWFWLRSSNGWNTSQAGSYPAFGGMGDVPMLADLDGDGKADLIVWRPSTGMWYWLQSTDSFTVQRQVAFGSGTMGDIPLVADIDGDGKADLAVWRPSNGTFYWLQSRQNFNPSAGGQIAFGTTGDIPMLLDMDGDQKADFVVWRQNDASGSPTWWWLLNGLWTTQSRVWGASGDVPLRPNGR